MDNPFVLQLKVLGFKKWQTLDIFDHLQLLELIKWLGLNYFDHIIQDSNDETEQTFNHFFSSVGCPFEADDLISAVGWAITRSIHILYSRTNTIHKASDLSSGDKKSIVKLLSLMGVSSCCDSTQNIITLEKSIEMFILNYQTQSGTKILDVNNVGTTHEFSDPFLNYCAKLLRLLYLKDLSELQKYANTMIAHLQEKISKPTVRHLAD